MKTHVCDMCGREIRVGQWGILANHNDGRTIRLRRAGFLDCLVPVGWIRMDICEDCFRNMREYCREHSGEKEAK